MDSSWLISMVMFRLHEQVTTVWMVSLTSTLPHQTLISFLRNIMLVDIHWIMKFTMSNLFKWLYASSLAFLLCRH